MVFPHLGQRLAYTETARREAQGRQFLSLRSQTFGKRVFDSSKQELSPENIHTIFERSFQQLPGLGERSGGEENGAATLILGYP